ncbi:hypothetical protein [Butyrivibrio sp. INlla14]|uniref:hypothetical protein n=1 Tax=Butyrivibrio sp. INlla14 TaxID=1520808 RepID=UPI000876BD74|nr:hypothetical protein [Butyrivibrio sp. INlla14]SCY76713.1 hypothetical protein SAMN02910371_03793 [Butyrivibrio sp. INlla14]
MSNYTVIPTDKFIEDMEFYYKKKKYTHIDEDVKKITDELEKGNLLGTEIPNIQVAVGEHTYKVRSANTDAKVGASNGYRIIYYVVKDDSEIFLVTIYSKKDGNRIPNNSELVEWIGKYCVS